ncbi:MAG: hypothetical protein ACOYJQ_08950 [Pseudochelatococcus sp.]|jgi:hypothetical protein|uniref:hypothetical protein n=1 Tax=Pseudochelatococcus sp. TaxID=2020869 RepID=UPI003D8CA643
MTAFFDTPIEEAGNELKGPFRAPRQMLGSQSYDGHASIHDDATAQKLGFRGGTIEGPTHFSQFDPLAARLFGEDWFESGCISSHFRNPVFEGDKVRAIVSLPETHLQRAAIRMEREDGLEVLRGTISVGPDHPPSALDERLAGLAPLEGARILADVGIGMRTPRRRIGMDFDQHMGELYPFTLAQKLERITEPSPLYREGAGRWTKPVIPFEMLSVLFCHINKRDPFPVRGPVVGLFADQEIRLLRGPLHVGQVYDIEREVVALSGSRRTESMWVRSTVYDVGGTEPLASMLLNQASLKASYSGYDEASS